MALNNVFYKPECMGTALWTVNPPVLQFHFPITEKAITTCGTNLKVLDLFQTIDVIQLKPT